MADRNADDIRKIVCLIGADAWSEYSEDVTNLLKEEYGAGADDCEFDVLQADGKKKKLKIDFNTMRQINCYTQRERRIKLIREGESVWNEDTFTLNEEHLA